ncbi:MAG: PKD domain-containing protein [Thermoplasmata archaeon]|nr:PKD domain-containing protein [Thermoplasmata archaeon]
MRRYIGSGVFSIVLLLMVATTFSPIAIASVSLLNGARSESVDVQEGLEADRPTGTPMGWEPPKPLFFPPDIQFCNAIPSPQQVGSAVNITCMINDDVGMLNAWVEVTDPDGLVVGNFSMLFDSGSMMWYNETIYYKAGVYTFTVTAEDTEGLFDWDDGMGAWVFLMTDITPPTITNETAAPSPQETGQNVNITCDVTDNGVVDEVWVEVWDPGMISLGNWSMSLDSGTGKWYLDQPYLDVGSHSFTITAYDSGGMWDVATGNFIMEDTTPPTISSVQEDPNPQQMNDNVNISAIVTDLDGISEVRLRVVDPTMAEVGNWSMSLDAGTGRYWDNRTYTMIGVYNYEIWARDPSGNWNSYFGTFTILADVTPPTISGQIATPDPQEVFFNVNITATITDNIAVFGAWVQVWDPTMGLVGNFSMGDAGGGVYFYEQSYGMLGTYTFTIWANDTFDWWSSASGSFVMQDTTVPVVDTITAIPNPQEVFLQVNISCRVTDNFGVQEVWVEIRDPTMVLVGNFSMVYDGGTGRWSYEQAYDIVGQYSFIIWALDTSGNWGMNTEFFLMEDTTPPQITGTIATPNPQESGSIVNITATVTDNYFVFEGFVEVFDPFLALVGNFSMIWDSLAGEFSFERSYWELGDYDYAVWATDLDNNWDSLQGNFTIIDTTDPVISSVQRTPQPQEVHLGVNISAIATDNYMVQQVVIDILDPIGGAVVSTDMGFDVGTGRYFYAQNFDMVGTYSCTIWARDTMNNQATSGCDFTMVDTTLPIISAITNVPAPGEVNAPLNVSAMVTDNYQVDVNNVWLNVLDPFGVPIGNFSMLFDSVSGRFYYERSYSQLGLHPFTIWAADVGGLWVKAQNGFLIDDNTPPMISSVTETPDPQEVYGNVNISADVTDNYQLAEVKVEIRNPIGGLVGNFSMVYDGGTGRWSYEQAYDMLGIYTTAIYARDIRSNVAAVLGSFLIRDTTPPTLLNTIASPDPQDAGGLVRIDSEVSDNFLLDLVYVEVFDPLMVSIINTTMTAGVTTHWYEQAYTQLGTHTFTITAWDSEGNVAIDTGSFVIVDLTPPNIGAPTATPDPQEVYGSVNVTVDVTDNNQIQNVYINITDPTAGSVGNFSMIDLGAGMFGYEQTYDMLGIYTCTIWAMDTSSNPASRACSFVVQDTTKPLISGPTEDPQPQNIGGKVNISALITDNFQMLIVKLEVFDPNSLPLGNETMNFDAASGRYYWDSAYVTVGTYDYNIFAWDTSSNVGAYSGTFAIDDMVSPTLTNTMATPDPQEVYNDVNITSRIEDNLNIIQTANVEITDPAMGFVGNFSMIDLGTGVFSYEQTYDMLGTYTFVIWASDPAGNWGTDSGSFVIRDTTPPEISNIVTTSPQEIEVGAIDITVTVTDIFDDSFNISVWITVLYPDGTLFENVSMSYDAGNGWFTYQNTFQVELGTYDFEIFALDVQNNQNSVQDSFLIQDTQDPVADAGLDQNVDQAVQVTFDGSGSSDNDPLFDTTVNYTWTFDDLGTQTMYGVAPTYAFVRGGEFIVTLTVTDRAGNTGTDTVTIHVVAGPSPPLTPRVTDPTETTLTISWDPPATYTDGTVIPGADIKGYTIYRAASSDGPYTELTFVTTPTYTDTGLVRNTSYFYKVTCWSLGDDIESEMSDYKSGTTTTVAPPPPDDGDGDERQDMMMYYLLIIIIIVAVVLAIAAVAMRKRKKPEEEELLDEEYEDEIYEDDDYLPPPPA